VSEADGRQTAMHSAAVEGENARCVV
jgi:hypothetical protein